MATSKQNFGLNPQQFTQLLEKLKQGDHSLFKTLFVSHFNDCKQFIRRKYGASEEDAYDATMDTVIIFRNRLLDNKIEYGNLRYLFTKMASQVYLRNTKQKQNEVTYDNLRIEPRAEDPYQEDQLNLLTKAWGALSNNCQDLLKLNFYQNMTLSAIAEQLGSKAATIRKQKERCMAKLIELYKNLEKAH